jgi:hypothetical protein
MTVRRQLADLVPDTHNGKRVAGFNATETALRKYGEAVMEVERAEDHALRAFRALDAATELCRALRIPIDARAMLPPILDAGYGVFKTRGPVEERLELAHAIPPPLP